MQPFCNPFRAPREDAPLTLLTHEYAPFRGGVATYVHELAVAARAQGYALEVWTVDYAGRLDRDGQRARDSADARAPFPVVRLPASGRLTPGGLWRLAWAIWRRRRRLRAGRTVLMSVGAQMVFIVLAKLRIVPAHRSTVLFHGSELLRFGRSRLWRTPARRFYEAAAGFAVTSRAVERLARGSGLLPPDALITLAPCGLPTTFPRDASPVGRPTGEGGDGTTRVLTVGRLHPRKGQLEVAHALALLPVEKRPGLIFQVVGVGDASYRRQVAGVCRAASIRCELLGELNDAALAEVYQRATVYVQASVTLPRSVEGFGLSLLEASFHGCPVAAYRAGGVEEAVRDGETGLLVAEGDRRALAAAIGRLLDDPDLRIRLGEAGHRFAGGFRWEGAARTLCEAALAT